MFGKDYPKKYVEQRPGEYDITLADYSKAKDKLGYKPTKNIFEYIDKVITE